MGRAATFTALALLASAAVAPVHSSGSSVSMRAHPPSTLLEPGVTTLPLQLATTQPTACRWSPKDVPFGAMSHSFDGAGETSHATTLVGLSGTVKVTIFHVRCAAYPGDSLTLVYRSLPDVMVAPFPRLGNLWGNHNFRGHPQGLKYAASRSSLWLGSDWTAAEIAELREANPYTVVLTSINACETTRTDLPDDFYLTNVTRPASTKGRLQSWPGAWRLDLTNPAVQEMQAQLMYGLVLYGGFEGRPAANSSVTPPMPFDGIFVDNVFMDDGQYVNTQDIFHNKFFPSTVTPGTADNPEVFAERWRAGMVAELDAFRRLMPHALMDGHISVSAMRQDTNISGMFNAVSIGFTTPEIIERRQSFADGMKQYTDWMTLPARRPHITMVESAVRFQIGYGYGFGANLTRPITSQCENSNSAQGAPPPAIGSACAKPRSVEYSHGYLKPQTYLFARSEYQYMRFGLGYTLMDDGFYTHELGDSWHGMDWDYDELHFSLGLATTNATLVNVSHDPQPARPAITIKEDKWNLYINKAHPGNNAGWSMDAASRPPATAASSVKVDVQHSTAGNHSSGDGNAIELHTTTPLSFTPGGYRLRFWAKASRPETRVYTGTLLAHPPWSGLGLSAQQVLSEAWAEYAVDFTCPSTDPNGKLSFFFGKVKAGTSVWINSPSLVATQVKPPVMRRDFECGVVLLNGDTVPRTIDLGATGELAAGQAQGAAGAPLYRLTGEQAPMHQYFVDDNSSSFTTTHGTWAVEDFDTGYVMAHAAQEQVRPAAGFAHHWGLGAHRASTAEEAVSAVFDLAVPEPGQYDVKLWWPGSAAPTRSTWAAAMRATLVVTDGAGPTPPPAGTVPDGDEERATRPTMNSTAKSTAVLAVRSFDLREAGGDEWLLVAQGVQLSPAGAHLRVDCAHGGGDCIADAVLVESKARWNDGSQATAVTLQAFDAIVLRKKSSSSPACRKQHGK